MTPTDSEILDVIVVRSGEILPTYYLKNTLRRQFRSITTPWLLRRLKAMEKAGKVRRVPSSYATMICWDVAQPNNREKA
jgi:Fe2+ or Zn2+ uptake regulation protein